MGPALHITISFTRPPEASIRAWRNGMKEAHAIQGKVWHDEMLPDHFKTYSKFKYGHKPRSAMYIRDKVLSAQGKGRYRNRAKAEDGGRVDNVFTGNLRRSMLEPARIRAFPSRVTIRMIGPRYVSMKPYKSNQPDKGAEITAVTADQAKRLDDVLAAEHDKRFKAAPADTVTVEAA